MARIRRGDAACSAIAGRGIVLDVADRTSARSGAAAIRPPCRRGVGCTVNTDDPAMFGNDLGTEHATARRLGETQHGSYEAGLAGALCDSGALAGLRRIGDEFDWAGGDSGSSMRR